MVNGIIYSGLVVFFAGVGMLIGNWWFKRQEKRRGQQAYEEFKKADIELEGLIKEEHEEVSQPIQENPLLPPQNLKPCWICGKMTIYDICSQEHYQIWLQGQNNTHMSEPSDQGNKAGDPRDLNQNNYTSSTPAPQTKKKVKVNDN